MINNINTEARAFAPSEFSLKRLKAQLEQKTRLHRLEPAQLAKLIPAPTLKPA